MFSSPTGCLSELIYDYIEFQGQEITHENLHPPSHILGNDAVSLTLQRLFWEHMPVWDDGGAILAQPSPEQLTPPAWAGGKPVAPQTSLPPRPVPEPWLFFLINSVIRTRGKTPHDFVI